MFETSSLEALQSECKFADISYPWRGLSPLTPPPQGALHVAGAEDCIGGISIDDLVTTCVAALREKCPLLWFAQMCILQLNEDDKYWQIERVNSLFSRCAVCLALLGGVHRLAGLDEETSWARRAWTLQEALVPPVTKCVFRWTNGLKCAMYNYKDKAEGVCALAVCVDAHMFEGGGYGILHDGAVWSDAGSQSVWREGQEEGDACACAREHEEGVRADWLGTAVGLGPAKFMSTMPEFPEIQDEHVTVQTHNGRKKVRDVKLDMYWYLVDAPTGSVNDKGYLHFCGNARPIREVSFLDDTGDFNLRYIKASPSKIFDSKRANIEPKRALWEVLPTAEGASATTFEIVVGKATFAIVVGKAHAFFFPEVGMFMVLDDVIVMIVAKIADGHGFHRIASASE